MTRPARRASAQVLSQEDFVMLADFRHALRLFLAASSTAVRGAGLTPQQHQALLAIKSRGGRGMSVGELAEQMLLRHHSAGELVERLCRAQLAERAPDPKDGRRVIVRLTRKAEAVLGRLTITHVAELNRVRPALARLLEQLPPPP